MASKSTKKLQDKKNTLASSARKTQDGNTETMETELNPAMSKAMAAITSNISEMIEAKFDSFLHKIGDIAKELQNTTKRVDEAEQRISAVEDTNVDGDGAAHFIPVKSRGLAAGASRCPGRPRQAQKYQDCWLARIFRGHFGHTFHGVVDSPGSRNDHQGGENQAVGFFRERSQASQALSPRHDCEFSPLQ